jgi:tetrahydromethanopterin S-methyltransferase subunit C
VTDVGVRDAAQEVVDQSTLVAQRAADDLKRQGRELGIGVGYGAGAVVLAVFAIGFALATIAVALDLVLPLWLSMLIVTLLIVLVGAVLAFLARRQFEKGTPTMPVEQADRERVAEAIAHLRAELARAAKLRVRVPIAAAAAGFVLGGGLRAVARLVRRR